MRIFDSISFKFTARYLTILGILLLILGCSVYFSLSKRMHDSLDNTLQERAKQISLFRDVIDIVAGGTFEWEPGELISFYYYSDDEVQDVSLKGRNIGMDKAQIDYILRTGESVYSTITARDEIELRSYSMVYSPSSISNTSLAENDTKEPAPEVQSARKGTGVDQAVLGVARSTKAIDVALNQLFWILVLALPLTLLLMGCCGIFLLRVVLRPVQNITDTAKEIEAEDLSRRIGVNTQDELGSLADTLNHMIRRLEKAFRRQKELTGDASHELRAPLAVIQAEATLALQKERDAASYKDSLQIIARESEHMNTIIAQLLFLARADSGNEHIDLVKLDIAPFLQDLIAGIEPLADEKGQSFELNIIDSAMVMGDISLLRTVMLNLLRNGMQYSPEGGTITVSLKKESEMATIKVSDNGIGIPEESLPYIFNRFYRVDKDRSRESGDSGLGLAICKHVIDLHGGQIKVFSEVGRGTSFIVNLPLVD